MNNKFVNFLRDMGLNFSRVDISTFPDGHTEVDVCDAITLTIHDRVPKGDVQHIDVIDDFGFPLNLYTCNGSLIGVVEFPEEEEKEMDINTAKEIRWTYNPIRYGTIGKCPTCSKVIQKAPRCPECGQLLKETTIKRNMVTIEGLRRKELISKRTGAVYEFIEVSPEFIIMLDSDKFVTGWCGFFDDDKDNYDFINQYENSQLGKSQWKQHPDNGEWYFVSNKTGWVYSFNKIVSQKGADTEMVCCIHEALSEKSFFDYHNCDGFEPKLLDFIFFNEKELENNKDFEEMIAKYEENK